jgi:putative SOS response-associated peptidase YedK
MCNLYSITTNQSAIIALFRAVKHNVGNLPPMPGVFPDYPAPVVRNAGAERELVMMRWGMPPPPKFGGPPVTNIRNTSSPHWRRAHRGPAFSASSRLFDLNGETRTARTKQISATIAPT